MAETGGWLVPHELDPRWEWVECPAMGMPTEWVRGECRHLETVDVDGVVTGEVLARICLTCSRQLPPSRIPPLLGG